MKLRLKRLALAMGLVPLAIVGCGGSGSSNTSTATPETVSLTVMDGYLENATVCLDQGVLDGVFADQECFETKTDSKGQIQIDPKVLGGAIKVVATAGQSIDRDFGEKALQSDLVLFASSGSTVISPLTDLVYKIAQAKDSQSKVISKEHLGAAQAEVLQLLNDVYKTAPDQKTPSIFTAEDLSKDFVAGSSESNELAKLYMVAQALATVSMSEAKPTDATQMLALQKRVVTEASKKVKNASSQELVNSRLPVTISNNGELAVTIEAPISLPVLDEKALSEISKVLSGKNLQAGESSKLLSDEILPNVAGLFSNTSAATSYKLAAAENNTGVAFNLDSSGALLIVGKPAKAGIVNTTVIANTKGFEVQFHLKLEVKVEAAVAVDAKQIDKIESDLKALDYKQNIALEYALPEAMLKDLKGRSVTFRIGSQMVAGMSVVNSDPVYHGLARIVGKPAAFGSGNKIHFIIVDEFGAEQEVLIDLPEIVKNDVPVFNAVKDAALAAEIVKLQVFGADISFSIAEDTFSDPNNDALTITAGADMVKGVTVENGQLKGKFEDFGGGKFIHILVDDGREGVLERKYPLGKINRLPVVKSGVADSGDTLGSFSQSIADSAPMVGKYFELSVAASDFFEDADKDSISIALGNGSAKGIQLSSGKLFGVWEKFDITSQNQKIKLVATDTQNGTVTLEGTVPKITKAEVNFSQTSFVGVRQIVDYDDRNQDLIYSDTGQYIYTNSQLSNLSSVKIDNLVRDARHGDLPADLGAGGLSIFKTASLPTVSPYSSLAQTILFLSQGKETSDTALQQVLDILNENSTYKYSKLDLSKPHSLATKKSAILAAVGDGLMDFLPQLVSSEKIFTAQGIELQKDFIKKYAAELRKLSLENLKKPYVAASFSGDETVIVLGEVKQIPGLVVRSKQLEVNQKLDDLNLSFEPANKAITEVTLAALTDLFSGETPASYGVKSVGSSNGLTISEVSGELKLSGTLDRAGEFKHTIVATYASGYKVATDLTYSVGSKLKPVVNSDANEALERKISDYNWVQNIKLKAHPVDQSDFLVPDDLFVKSFGVDDASKKLKITAGSEMMKGIILDSSQKLKLAGRPMVSGENHKIHLVATNELGGIAEVKFDIPNVGANSRPQLNQQAYEELKRLMSLPWSQGDKWDFELPKDLATDAEDSSLTYSKGYKMVDGLDVVNGRITGTLNDWGSVEKGTEKVLHIYAKDSNNNTLAITVTLDSIAPLNYPPVPVDGAADDERNEVLGAIGKKIEAQNWVTGQEYSIEIPANELFTDPDGDDITVELLYFENAATFPDPDNEGQFIKRISYQNNILTVTWRQFGEQRLIFKVTDKRGASAQFGVHALVLPDTDKLTVDNSIVEDLKETLADMDLKVGTSLESVKISSNLFTDPDGSSVANSRFNRERVTVASEMANGIGLRYSAWPRGTFLFGSLDEAGDQFVHIQAQKNLTFSFSDKTKLLTNEIKLPISVAPAE